MVRNYRLNNWSDAYWNQINRNIGLISSLDQEKLRKCPIAIFGVGGLGGPLAEQLIRAGCEQLIICDNEKFEESNLNRQICIKKDIGKNKIDIIESYLKKINSEINIKKYFKVNENNISNILENVSVLALTLDDPVTSILTSRECFKRKIPMVETWAIPYLCAWWFSQDSIDYETCYGFKTHNLAIEDIQKSKSVIIELKKALLNKLLLFPGIKESFDQEKGVVEALLSGEIPSISFVPIVRIAASYLAYELIFSGILKKKMMSLAPKIIGYDYFRMKTIEFNL